LGVCCGITLIFSFASPEKTALFYFLSLLAVHSALLFLIRGGKSRYLSTTQRLKRGGLTSSVRFEGNDIRFRYIVAAASLFSYRKSLKVLVPLSSPGSWVAHDNFGHSSGLSTAKKTDDEFLSINRLDFLSFEPPSVQAAWVHDF